MLNNKLTALLESFSKADRQRFRKYLASPFFNESADMSRLYEIARGSLAYVGKTPADGKKLGWWEQMYPGKPYDDTRFRRICSDLLRHALDFKAYEHFRASEYAGRIHTLEALAATKLNKHFDGIVRQMDSAPSPLRDADYHLATHHLHRFRHEHAEHELGKAASLELSGQADFHLDCYYFSKKLRHYCDMLGYRKMVAGEAKIHLLPGFFEYLKASPHLEEPAVKLYYLVAQMMLHPEEEAFFQHAKSLLDSSAALFQLKELKTLFIHLMNYCIDTKINNGRGDYYAELLLLYQTALEQEIIFENSELDPNHYKNIVTIALHVKEFAWVEGFIKDYTRRLPRADQENALQYNMAQLYFNQGRYEKVIEQLRGVDYQTLVYAIGSRLLLLRTYYELKEFLVLDSFIDSFSIYLRRNRLISKEVKQQCLNLLRFTKRLAGLAPYDRAGLEKIRVQVEGCKVLAVKRWVLEKVSELGR